MAEEEQSGESGVKYSRLTDNDRNFGPFTLGERNSHWKPLALSLRSGDDEHCGCSFNVQAFGYWLRLKLPSILLPQRRWVVARYSQNPEFTGYWDVLPREFGFHLNDGHLSVHYGVKTMDSSTDKRWGYFLPWAQWRHVRHSWYNTDGTLFAHEPTWSGRLEDGGLAKAMEIEKLCPAVEFDFHDFDGEKIRATCKISEREWRFGEGWFKWLSLLRKHRVIRSLDLRFSAEVGKRKGSWKGGTIGHSIEMLAGESQESAFRRYCCEHNLAFVGPAA